MRSRCTEKPLIRSITAGPMTQRQNFKNISKIKTGIFSRKQEHSSPNEVSLSMTPRPRPVPIKWLFQLFIMQLSAAGFTQLSPGPGSARICRNICDGLRVCVSEEKGHRNRPTLAHGSPAARHVGIPCLWHISGGRKRGSKSLKSH